MSARRESEQKELMIKKWTRWTRGGDNLAQNEEKNNTKDENCDTTNSPPSISILFVK